MATAFYVSHRSKLKQMRQEDESTNTQHNTTSTETVLIKQRRNRGAGKQASDEGSKQARQAGRQASRQASKPGKLASRVFVDVSQVAEVGQEDVYYTCRAAMLSFGKVHNDPFSQQARNGISGCSHGQGWLWQAWRTSHARALQALIPFL